MTNHIKPYAKPDMEIAKRIFAALETHWREDVAARGIYRPCYDVAENEAIEICMKEAKALGLEVFCDLAGNVYFLLEGTEPTQPIILSGSHVDSVPYGGRYDGTAGVAAAMSAIGGIVKAGLKLKRGLCAVIWRGEESAWFGQVSIGSKFAVGELSTDVLQKPNLHAENSSLSEAMRKIGLHPEKLANGKKLLPLAQIASFIELHIEQGAMLENRGFPVGIVSGIRGNIRYAKIECLGEAGHTGTVPHEMRRDAVRATTRLICELEDYFVALQQLWKDLVFTFPIIKTSATASLTTIPDFCEFAIEVRSVDDKILDDCANEIKEKLQQISLKYNVDFRFSHPPTRSAPATMNSQVQEQLNTLAITQNLPIITLPSGAGHDAAIIANAGVASGMIFIRHDGISHRHDESMGWQDFTLGTELLTNFFCNAITPKIATQKTFKDALLELGASIIGETK